MWILLRLLLIGLRLAPTARRDLILENLALRHQLAVCARPHRPHLLDCLPEPTMGAIRIVGELRALGIEASASAVRSYRREGAASTTVAQLALLPQPPCPRDLGGGLLHRPDAHFRALYVFVVIAHERRRIMHVNVTAHPTATGSGDRSSRPRPGEQHRASSFVTETAAMAVTSTFGCASSAWRR